MDIATATAEIAARQRRGDFRHDLPGIHDDLAKLVRQQAGFFGRTLVAFARKADGDYHYELGKAWVHSRPDTYVDFDTVARPHHNAVIVCHRTEYATTYTASYYYFKHGQWRECGGNGLMPCRCHPEFDATPALLDALGA